MRLPSKITPYDRSLIARFPILLKEIEKGNVTPSSLYMKTKKRFSGLGEFIQALECLYALGKIDWSQETEVLAIVG